MTHEHKQDYENSGILNLAAGIVEQACKDYLFFKKAVMFERSITKRIQAEKELRDIDDFFKSSWYGFLCDLDPAIILSELDAQFEQYAQTRRRRYQKEVRRY